MCAAEVELGHLVSKLQLQGQLRVPFGHDTELTINKEALLDEYKLALVLTLAVNLFFSLLNTKR